MAVYLVAVSGGFMVECNDVAPSSTGSTVLDGTAITQLFQVQTNSQTGEVSSLSYSDPDFGYPAFYIRQCFGRFNLSSITGTVTGVRLRQKSTASGTVHMRQYAYSSSASSYRSQSQVAALPVLGSYGFTGGNTVQYATGTSGLVSAVQAALGGNLDFVFVPTASINGAWNTDPALAPTLNFTSVAADLLTLEITTAGGGTDATFTSLVGDTAASGGTTTFTAQSTGTFATIVGDTAASGGVTTITGTTDATFTTLVGDTAAAGGVTTFTGTTDATFTTLVGDTSAAGGVTTFTAQSTGTFATIAGDTSAAGGVTTFTAQASVTFSTLAGNLTADGGISTFNTSGDTLRSTRQRLAYEIAGSSWTVYEEPPTAIQTPAVIIQPADPYLELVSIGDITWKVAYEITYAVTYQDNKAALNAIETLIQQIIPLLGDQYAIGPISAPAPIDVAGASLLTAQQTLTTYRTG